LSYDLWLFVQLNGNRFCGTIETMSNQVDGLWIVERAKGLGFVLCGVARPEGFPELGKFREWLERGYAGEMKYLDDSRRAEPQLVMKDLRSVIVCALNYNTDYPYSTVAGTAGDGEDGASRGWISRYAWGDDYHEVMWEKLNALSDALKERYSQPFTIRAYADTGPVAERIFAKYAGLGWLGKNTLLLNEEHGSWLFLGVIFTSLEVAPTLSLSEPPPPDLCGNCRQCLDACPTGALVEPYVLDARRCISYLTIELRGKIPEELRVPVGWQVYGCDICQDVCPYNRKASVTSIKEFQPRQKNADRSLFKPSLEWLARMDEQEFRVTFRKSAVKRTKWAGLVRNACIALGNTKFDGETEEYRRIDGILEGLEQSEISTISESARWARKRIKMRPK
jgi:epoxyqueuosine reductase